MQQNNNKILKFALVCITCIGLIALLAFVIEKVI